MNLYKYKRPQKNATELIDQLTVIKDETWELMCKGTIAIRSIMGQSVDCDE